MKCFLFVLESNGIEHEKETLPKFKQMEETPADISVELQENGDMEQHQQASASDAADSELEEQKICDSEEPETKEIHENFKPVNETIYEETPDVSDRLQDNDDLEQHQQAVVNDVYDLEPEEQSINGDSETEEIQENLETEKEKIHEETSDVSVKLEENGDPEQASDVAGVESEDQRTHNYVEPETEEMRENYETENEKVKEEIELEGEKMEEIESVEITPDIGVKTEYDYAQEEHGYFLATAAVSDAAKTTCDVCNKERIINTL